MIVTYQLEEWKIGKISNFSRFFRIFILYKLNLELLTVANGRPRPPVHRGHHGRATLGQMAIPMAGFPASGVCRLGGAVKIEIDIENNDKYHRYDMTGTKIPGDIHVDTFTQKP